MSERIFFDLYGDRFCVQRAENGRGFQKAWYRFDVKKGCWVPGDVIDYDDFGELLLGIFREQFARTNRSPLEVFDAANLVMCQMKEEVIRVRDL